MQILSTCEVDDTYALTAKFDDLLEDAEALIGIPRLQAAWHAFAAAAYASPP